MPLWDINDLLEGLSYKGRQEWERVRTASYITIAPHCKKIDKNKMLPFPWDNDNKEEQKGMSAADIERMRSLAKRFETSKGD
mgnify:CR=1 FL=1